VNDCFTCEFAKRDIHNRFEDRCSGFSNCSYSKFEGNIKPTLKQYLEDIQRNISTSKMDNTYKNGFNFAIQLIDEWEATE